MPVLRKRKAETEKTAETRKKKKDGVRDEEKVQEVQEKDDVEEKKDEEVDEDEDASDLEDILDEEREQEGRKYTLENAWTSTQIRNGFTETDYPAKGPFKQKHEFRRHLTKLAMKGNKKYVPPAHPEWPVKAFQKVKDVPGFVKSLANEPVALEILRNEFDVETGTTNRSTVHFPDSITRYYGWTGMIQIEKTFPAIMENCQGFLKCLENAYNEWLKNKPLFEEVEKVLTDMNTILGAMTKTVHPSAVVSIKLWVGGIYAPLKKIKEFHPLMEKATTKNWSDYPSNGPLVVPENYKKAALGSGSKRLERYLKAPKIVDELAVTEGVTTLVKMIWGDDMDTSQKPDLDDRPEKNKTGGSVNKRVRAALCLLEIVCGSRLRGVMLTNWFSRFESESMHEWVKERKDKNKKSPYGSWDRCIVVTRLSKEGSKVKRAKRESDISGKQVGEDDVQDSVIVKPLNVMFLDRAFLNAKSFKNLGNKTDTEVVNIFIRLVTAVRAYMFSERLFKVHKLKSMEKGGMKGLTDEAAELLPKSATIWTQNTTRDVVLLAKDVFKFIGKNQGTHMLRKVYMAWSYNAFARDSMKETGYASEVLGHRGFAVSLNYTALILKNSVIGDVTDTYLIKKTFTDMSDRIDKLEERLSRFGKKYITIQGVEYEVLPKATKGEDPVARASKLIDMMTKDGVQWNWTRLLRLGGSTITTDSTRMAIEEKYFKNTDKKI